MKLYVLAWVGLFATGAAAATASSEAAAERLRAELGPRAQVRLDPRTRAARFANDPAGLVALRGEQPADRAADFVARFGPAFGITDAARQLSAPAIEVDRYGHAHVRYGQMHRGVPVFGSAVGVHFDPAGRLVAAQAAFLPDLAVDVTPFISANEAHERALGDVMARTTRPVTGTLAVARSRSVVLRTGLAQRVAGTDHLAYEVEVIDAGALREFVYVDAHDGRVVERLPGSRDALSRRIHQPTWEGAVVWTEGDALPYASGNAANDQQVNSLIDQSGGVYDLFFNLSGGSHPSWDGQSGTLHSIFKPAWLVCPNAIWNGRTTAFCDGVTGDDLVAHEWTHAYTEGTHDLIYVAQPGALNEAYSDIFGELLDQQNGAGTDTPAPARVPGDCSAFGAVPPPLFAVTAPAALAGAYPVGGALFNPQGPIEVTAALETVQDAVNIPGDGCEAFVGFTPGRIAIVDRGTCAFPIKAVNAQNAGAAGVLVVNTTDDLITMGGAASVTIPSVLIRASQGAILRAAPEGSVSATIALQSADAVSYRWLIGEDGTALGPIRDLWNPVCFGDPGKVSDPWYACGPADNGGVHVNSGIPNHAFALLVDGGSYNGRTVGALGPTKAGHLYWRAMSVYQVPDSDFSDHADALSQSCLDLLGVGLVDLVTGEPSGLALDADDCAQVEAAIEAVELRGAPGCDFGPLLDPTEPPLVCPSTSFADDFETDPAAAWTFSNAGVFAGYVPRDWTWTSALPAGRAGAALFADDARTIGDCIPGVGDQSRRVRVDSPPIVVGASPILAFDHYVATEYAADGGRVAIAVNGGAFVPVEQGDFLFNAYNSTLAAANAQNANPLAGQRAFSGSDGGSTVGSWARSLVALGRFAAPGDTIRVRFEFGTDGCTGLVGWFVDDVRVCQDATVANSPSRFVALTGPGNPILTDVSTPYSGTSWVDFDGDGDEDLFVNNGFLYRNDGGNTFVRMTTNIGSGIAAGASGNGNTWGDYDNDGDLDVYVASSTSYLYRNDGASGFTRIISGEIGNGTANRGWAAAWADLDLDGDLDLAVTHPAGYLPGNPTTNHLFLNNGPPDYSFTRVTTGPIVTGFAAYTVGTWSDYDDDGDPDYFIGAGPANGTTSTDYLYRNRLVESGSATFQRITTAPIATDLNDGQLWRWIDYDNDSDLDAYVTNWGGQQGGMRNRLYRRDGAGYTPVTTGAIVTDAHISLSSVWGDYDNDGDLDCFVTNDANQPDRHYDNLGDGTFASLTTAATQNLTHHGATSGDFDGDGRLDLYLDGPSGARRLYRNDTANGNHWLELRLAGTASNRAAIGTQVHALATIRGVPTWQRREVTAQSTFNGQDSLIVHFGLGDAALVERLVVVWPSGIVQTRGNVAADRRLAVPENAHLPPVPDGATVPGELLRAARVADEVELTWDAASCPAESVNVYWGAIGDFTTVVGGACGLDDTGLATLGIPGDSWFIVATTDGEADGSWGSVSGGTERLLTGTEAACPGIVEHVVSDRCP